MSKTSSIAEKIIKVVAIVIVSIVLLYFLLIGAIMLVLTYFDVKSTVSEVSVSPNGEYQVEIVDRKSGPDWCASYVYVENSEMGFSSVGDTPNSEAMEVKNIWKEHDDLSEFRWLSDNSFSVICYLEDEIFYDIVEINGSELIVTKAITMDWDESEIGNIDHSGERLAGDCTLHVTNNTSDKITFYVYALSFDGNKALPYNRLTSSDEDGHVLYFTLEAYEEQDLQVHLTGDKDEEYGDRANNFARGHIYFKIVDVDKGI